MHTRSGNGSTRIWRASRGREIPLYQLADEHLINILNWIERGPRSNGPGKWKPNFEQSNDDYFYLRNEAMRRGLRWRQYAEGPPLWDGDLTYPYRESPRGRYPNLEDQHVPVSVRDPVAIVPVGSLSPGERFRRSGIRDTYIVLRPQGTIHAALRNYGHDPVGFGKGEYSRDETIRVVVANLRNGVAYMLPSYEQVERRFA